MLEIATGLVEPKINNEIDRQFFAEVKKLPAKEVLPDFLFNSYNDTIVQVETDNGPVVIIVHLITFWFLIVKYFQFLNKKWKSLV